MAGSEDQLNRSGHRTATVVAWQVAIATIILVGWELYGRFVDANWLSRPSDIAMRIAEWARGDLVIHAAVTLGEMAAGLAIGVPLGTLLGLVLGRMPLVAALLRPIIFGLYSVPLVTLAPLLIFWFGLGMTPKIVLVAIVSFFLLFFTVFSGVQNTDRDLISTFELLGATRREVLTKLIAPSCMAWIFSGLRVALPYALIAAVVGEMLLSRQGLGYLLMQASQQIDMTGVYAALLVLLAAGVIIAAIANAIERRMLRWRGRSV